MKIQELSEKLSKFVLMLLPMDHELNTKYTLREKFIEKYIGLDISTFSGILKINDEKDFAYALCKELALRWDAKYLLRFAQSALPEISADEYPEFDILLKELKIKSAGSVNRSSPHLAFSPTTLGIGDLVYVVYCRIHGLCKFSNDIIAGNVSTLNCIHESLVQEHQLCKTYSSVYWRFLIVHATPFLALEIAVKCQTLAFKSGVSLAVGVASGKVEETTNFGAKNIAGAAINVAARLAHLPNSRGRIAFDHIVGQDLASSGVSPGSLTPCRESSVKETPLKFNWHKQRWPSAKKMKFDTRVNFIEETAHVVAFDIARYSGKALDDMVNLVHLLDVAARKAVVTGSGDSLWYSPGGDGGVVVFRATAHAGAQRAIDFAKNLLDFCRKTLELRVGIATGPVCIVENSLPVGWAVCEADRLSGLSIAGAICMSRRFFELLNEGNVRGWLLENAIGEPLVFLPPPETFISIKGERI